jgi:TRAP-type C4-dicarboxylate transport system permease small subunit
MATHTNSRWAGLNRLAHRAISGWAFAGGVVLLGVVAINVFSVAGGIFWKPFPGDFELTEIGVAIAAFSFLPYCQLTGANVTADIFTTRAPSSWIAGFSVLASLVALGFSLLLLSRMFYGMLDQKAFGYTTAILAFPHWIAFVPILVSLALLALASVLTLAEAVWATGRRAI